jgi:predicted acyl esterase
MGSIRGFLEIPHNDKWIHWASKQEWYELYSVPHAADELQVFFDHYLRNKKTDWPQRPKVRWSALQFGDREAIDDIVLEDFPVPSTKYEKFYLSEGKLLQSPVSTVSKSSYDSEKHQSFAEFVYTFPKAERLIGLPKAVLYMSCDDRDDFTTFVIIRKKDKNGKDLMHLNFPFSASPVKSIDEIPTKDQASVNLHLGSIGILRASHRAIDHSKSIHPQFPFHPHKKQEKVAPGTIVRLEIGIWAMGVDFDAGESISIRVSIM